MPSTFYICNGAIWYLFSLVTKVRKLRLAVEQGREEQVTIKNYRRDGSTYWSRVQIAPMRDSAGRVTLIVSVQYEVRGNLKDNTQCTTLCGPRRFAETSYLFVYLWRFLVLPRLYSPPLYRAIWVGCIPLWTGLQQTAPPLWCHPRKALRHPPQGAVRPSLMTGVAPTVGPLRVAGHLVAVTPQMTTGQLTGSAIRGIQTSSYIASVLSCSSPSQPHLVSPCRSLLHMTPWDYFHTLL